MKKLHRFIYVNKAERKALIAIATIIIIYLSANTIIKNIYNKTNNDLSIYSSLFEKIQTENTEEVDTQKFPEIEEDDTRAKIPKPSYKNFDPNTVTEKELNSMGINKKAIKNLVKYREKGGYFKEKEDLQKIYNLSSSEYKNIEKYINIPTRMSSELLAASSPNEMIIETSDSREINSLDDDTLATYNSIPGQLKSTYKSNTEEKSIKVFSKEKIEKPLLKIDINSADELELQYIKGIGPSYASRIIKYREMIGGFHSLHQLTEVYGLDFEKLNEIKDQIIITPNLRKLNINADNPKELKHPYLNYQQAKIIVAYKNQHGPFKAASELLKIKIMDTVLVEKLRPYVNAETK